MGAGGSGVDGPSKMRGSHQSRCPYTGGGVANGADPAGGSGLGGGRSQGVGGVGATTTTTTRVGLQPFFFSLARPQNETM